MRRRSILIVGGGPVGLALAALLVDAREPARFDIRVLEPRLPPAWSRDETDLRVYALSRASERILGTAGAWAAIVERRASPYRRMTVWEGRLDARIGTLRFDSAELGEPDLGHIVEDCLIRSALVDALAQHDAVATSFGVELSGVRVRSDRVEVGLADGRTLEADVLIAADGSASTVRTLLEIPTIERPYAQAAVVTHVRTSRSHEETAWQRFLPTGPVALLPLLDGRSSVVWSTSTEIAQTLLESSDVDFMSALREATDGVLGAITATGRRVSFPLRVIHAHRYCRHRVALVGDAAHTIHPLAGQGMNLGLLDAAVMAEVLTEAARAGEDPGDLRVLKRYERRQKGRNLKTLLAMDAINRLFSRAGPLLAPLRASGMTLIDSAPLAKRRLMGEALGILGELPASARKLRGVGA